MHVQVIRLRIHNFLRIFWDILASLVAIVVPPVRPSRTLHPSFIGCYGAQRTRGQMMAVMALVFGRFLLPLLTSPPIRMYTW